jgi:exosortase A
MKMELPSPSATAVACYADRLSTAQKYAFGLIAATIFWVLAWYADTTQSMIATWQRSDTFAHGFLIMPISAWLMWRRRQNLKAIEIRPDFIALPVLALIGFGWLLGESAGVTILQQYAVVLMIPVTVWAIAGRHMVRALAFPLFFLLFAVPFGEILLPPLMEYTAHFVILALRLTGIPVYREGLFFTIPSGSWSVVEACSGLRYLIASVTIGFLYAHLMYRSLVRRAVFIAAAVVVPIVANWLRAYLIVMIGHVSSMQYAVGVDHLIYGWLFFGIVMALLFWIAAFWREDLDLRPTAPDQVGDPAMSRSPLSSLAVASIAAAVLVSMWPLAGAQLDGYSTNLSPKLHTPAAAGGWQATANHDLHWTPRFANPRAQLNQVYRKDYMHAGLYIAYYVGQRSGAELISSVNRLVGTHESGWLNTGETARTLSLGDQQIPSIEAQLRRPSSTRLLVWRWYRVDGEVTASPHRAKFLQAKSRLLGRGDDGAVIMVYTDTDENLEVAARRLQDFLSTVLPGINRSVDHAR